MKRTRAAAILLAAVLLGGCAATDKLAAVDQMTIATPDDLTSIEDGTYAGGYDGGFTVVDLTVTVSDGAMEEIELLRHDNGRGEPAEAIIDDVLREQSLEVDTISGATISSKVILKSVERALTEAPREGAE
ncbi:MAG: FMN-binding protein [Spirochaetes bacterium]|jgi:uncharacterized protein with FMN-binding domain|nr:FMN-binding protein [Spirochaetota bacterium]